MRLDKTDEVVDKVRDWSVDRMENVETVGDKIALYEEFEEWIELDGEDSIEIMSFGTKTIDKGDKKRESGLERGCSLVVKSEVSNLQLSVRFCPPAYCRHSTVGSAGLL